MRSVGHDDLHYDGYGHDALAMSCSPSIIASVGTFSWTLVFITTVVCPSHPVVQPDVTNIMIQEFVVSKDSRSTNVYELVSYRRGTSECRSHPLATFDVRWESRAQMHDTPCMQCLPSSKDFSRIRHCSFVVLCATRGRWNSRIVGFCMP